MQARNKAKSDCDVKVAIDKGSIRLSFPKRHTPLWELMDGKSLKGKPKYLYLGKAGFSGDNPDDCKRAAQIAIAMESDLDHPEWDKLFDRTLEKYGLAGLLGGKYAKLADVLQMPGTTQVQPEITVGEMWEAYLEWKKPSLEETTFKLNYEIVFTNAIKSLVWNNRLRLHQIADCGSIWNMSLDTVDIDCFLANTISVTTQRKVLSALSEAFTRLITTGKTNVKSNPFVVSGGITKDKADKYKPKVNSIGELQDWWNTSNIETDLEHNDVRAFTKNERDIIIKAFYESDRGAANKIAPLIEFLFLTGCRSGEVFALRWQDICVGASKQNIVFGRSYNGRLKNTQVTKTKEIRLFKLYPKLDDLLRRIKPDNCKSTDLLFCNTQGVSYNSGSLDAAWRGYRGNKNGKTYSYPGVVTELVEEGAISGYLSPYHTRHTFITLQAHAGTDLLLLATACGNSVEVIQRHYLGVNTEVEMTKLFSI